MFKRLQLLWSYSLEETNPFCLCVGYLAVLPVRPIDRVTILPKSDWSNRLSSTMVWAGFAES